MISRSPRRKVVKETDIARTILFYESVETTLRWEYADRIQGAGRKYNTQELMACALLLLTLLENEGLLKSPIKALQPIKN